MTDDPAASMARLQQQVRAGDYGELHAFNNNLVDEFRANDGKVSGVFANAPLVLLTTTGAKSGKRSTVPLVYLPDGDRIVIFGTKAGADTHPAWYHNLVKNPQVTVEVQGATYEAKAIVLEGEERDRKYREQAELFPNFAYYEQGTSRKIPVIALERV